MTETRTTTALYPPGRYGRRRDPGRRPWVPVLVAVAMLGACLLLGVKLYGQYGDPTYDAQVISYTGVTDTQVLIEFTVRVPPGGSATCALRARSFDGADVGHLDVTVTAAANEQQIRATHPVPTTSRAFIGEVLRCRAAG